MTKGRWTAPLSLWRQHGHLSAGWKQTRMHLFVRFHLALLRPHHLPRRLHRVYLILALSGVLPRVPNPPLSSVSTLLPMEWHTLLKSRLHLFLKSVGSRHMYGQVRQVLIPYLGVVHL